MNNTDIKKIRKVFTVKDNSGCLYLVITNVDLEILHFFGDFEISGTMMEALNELRKEIDVCLYFDNDIIQLQGTSLELFFDDVNFDVKEMFTMVSEYED